MFFWPIGKTRWPAWPLIGWDIFDFSSETAEQNSTKLDRKHDLNVLYQVCVFQADRKNKMAALASDWLRHFRLLLWDHWTEFNKTWQEARSKHTLPSLCFFGRSEKQDGRPGLWLAETFRLLLWNCWTEFNETWQEARSQCPLPSLYFSPFSKQRWPPRRIPQKGGTLYSGALYVALWASCYRGGGGRCGKKKSGSDLGGKKSSAQRAGKKNFRHAAGSAFALRKLLSHSKNRYSQCEICFSHSVNCFFHSEHCIMYYRNDFSRYKKVFCSLKTVSCTLRTLAYAKSYYMDVESPFPFFVLMKMRKWAPVAFKKYHPSRRACKKIFLLQK